MSPGPLRPIRALPELQKHEKLGELSGFPLAMNGSILVGRGRAFVSPTDGFGWLNRLQEIVTDPTRQRRRSAVSAANADSCRATAGAEEPPPHPDPNSVWRCEAAESPVSSNL